jgi:hypothetical protein
MAWSTPNPIPQFRIEQDLPHPPDRRRGLRWDKVLDPAGPGTVPPPSMASSAPGLPARFCSAIYPRWRRHQVLGGSARLDGGRVAPEIR